MPVFECNICLDSVQDPVVTLCGHLFCRPCLDKWLQFHSHRHECPVCKARVDDDKLVPIYGNGSSSSDLLLDIPSQQPQTAPVSPELPPELTYVRQDRSHAPQGLTCNCLFGAISSVWSILVVAVSSIWNLLFSAISSVCSILSGAISSIWNILVVVMSSIWNLLFSAISSIWNILVIGITCVWNTLADTECLWIPPQAQRNPLAFLTICFIGFLLLYIFANRLPRNNEAMLVDLLINSCANENITWMN